MKFPSKITTFKESIFFQILKILEQQDLIDDDEIELKELYKKIKKNIDLSEFIDAICILNILEEIKVNDGVLKYVNRGKM